MNSLGEELESSCAPLHTFQESLHRIFSSRIGSQALQMASSLQPLTSTRLSTLSRGTKAVLVSGCVGAVLYLSLTWFTTRAKKKKRSQDSGQTARSRRQRTGSLSRSTFLSSGDPSASSLMFRSYNWAELQKQSVSDQDSVVSTATLVDGTQLAPQQLGLMGMEALETVIGYWEDALAAYNPTANNLVLTTKEESEFRQSVEDILDRAYSLQEMAETLFIHQNSVLNKREAFVRQKEEVLFRNSLEGGSGRSGRRSCALSVSTLEDVSFVSAEESVADLRDFDELSETAPLDVDRLPLYRSALELHQTSGIPYRIMRTEFLGCASDLDYLAKLHCLRLAFRNIMKEETNRTWWADNGRAILAQLLVKSDKDPQDFLTAFEDMVDYLKGGEQIITQMQEELRSRNVQCINFYDICLDYILIDSFEDLESPPSSVLAVMKNRWLSNSFKESALQAAIWSVFQTKRRLLAFPNGFKAKFYNLSEILTPSLAWAFFGPDEELCQLMNEFKSEVLAFLADIFSFSRVDYSSVEELSQSVMNVAKERLESVRRRLDC